MSAIDLTFLKKHFGKWVALSQDEKKIVANGKTLKEVRDKVKKINYEDPIFTKVVDLASFI